VPPPGSSAAASIAAVTQTELERPPAPPESAPAQSRENVVDRVFVIRPAPRWPHLDFSELWHYRELLFRFVWRDVKVRYKQSFLGFAWALIVPIFTATVYVIIFGKFAKFPNGEIDYPILVFAGLLPMQLFTSGLTQASTSLVTNSSLVTKVYFPRVLLPLAGVLVPLVDFAIALVVMVLLMARYDTWPSGPEALLAPAFIALALVSALGGGFLLSALNVRYRDVPYAIPVFLQVLPFVSGVPYAVSELPEKWQWILSVNPITSVVAGWRWALLSGPAPNPGQVAVGVAVAVVLLLGGLMYFRSSEPRFADTI
jgi:homopolymeric O-antigen transport system permease protein